MRLGWMVAVTVAVGQLGCSLDENAARERFCSRFPGRCISIDRVEPREGPAKGGTTIRVFGARFPPGAEVSVGGVPLLDPVVHETEITGKTPGGSPGAATLEIAGEGGGQGLEGWFEYLANRAPALEELTERELEVGTTLELSLSASDADEDPLAFTFESSPPMPGAVLDPSSGMLRWKPLVGEEGRYSMSFTVRDPSGEIASRTGSVEVKPRVLRELEVVAGVPGGAGNADGKGRDARFHYPYGLAFDALGNLYVGEFENHLLRKVSPGGVVTTLAGGSLAKKADGQGRDASFSYPMGVAVDTSGNVYVADSNNGALRKVTPSGLVTTLANISASGVAVDSSGTLFVTSGSAVVKVNAAGVVSPFAGDATQTGSVDGTGGAARFGGPAAIAIDLSGTLYVVDDVNYTIRKVTREGVVTTLAGAPGQSGDLDGVGSAARFKFGALSGIAVDRAGNLYVTEFYNSTIRRVTPSGAVTTLAGFPGQSGIADGTGNGARFSGPAGVAVDAEGNVFVSDGTNSTIRKVTPGGVVTTFAGAPLSQGGTDGVGTSARFGGPNSVALDDHGNAYVSESGNHTLRKVSPVGVVTTLAGASGQPGYADGPGSAARFSYPRGIAVDALGYVYVGAVRKVSPGGLVTTLAGSPDQTGSSDGVGVAARFNGLPGLATDASGNIYVADSSNHTLRKVTPEGVVTTLAGSAGQEGSVDGTGGAARFRFPLGVVADSLGNLYVADSGNGLVRRVTPAGVVTTVAGAAGQTGWSDGRGSSARFVSPNAITIDRTGNIFVCDSHVVRKVTADGAVTTVAGVRGKLGVQPGRLPASLHNPMGIVAAPDGTLFFVDETENVLLRLK